MQSKTTSKATQKKIDSMFNGDLPVVQAKVSIGYDLDGPIQAIIPVEVLTVNFNTQGMRVRYVRDYNGAQEIYSCDVDYTPFMLEYFGGKFDFR